MKKLIAGIGFMAVLATGSAFADSMHVNFNVDLTSLLGMIFGGQSAYASPAYSTPAYAPQVAPVPVQDYCRARAYHPYEDAYRGYDGRDDQDRYRYYNGEEPGGWNRGYGYFNSGNQYDR